MKRNYLENAFRYNRRTGSGYAFDHLQSGRQGRNIKVWSLTLVLMEPKLELSEVLLYEHDVRYAPGDVLMVQPRNLPSTISLALESLQYPRSLLEQAFVLQPSDEFTRLPPLEVISQDSAGRTSLLNCLERLFDLQQRPRPSFFEELASIAENEMEKERLVELASPSHEVGVHHFSIVQTKDVEVCVFTCIRHEENIKGAKLLFPIREELKLYSYFKVPVKIQNACIYLFSVFSLSTEIVNES